MRPEEEKHSKHLRGRTLMSESLIHSVSSLIIKTKKSNIDDSVKFHFDFHVFIYTIRSKVT